MGKHRPPQSGCGPLSLIVFVAVLVGLGACIAGVFS